MPDINCVDLYGLYPDFYIDVEQEQSRLKESDLIIFLHPIYWYGAPSLLKEWQCRVLLRGFAYDENHFSALKDKDFWQIVSAGGSAEKYSEHGYFGCDMPTFLKPYQAMANKCQMTWHPPKVLFRAHNISDNEINKHAQDILHTILNYQKIGKKALNNS